MGRTLMIIGALLVLAACSGRSSATCPVWADYPATL